MTTPYTAGTVTLTNGSAVITGIGTAWQTALIAGGILIAEADGNPLPILSVDSNTQITAAIKWKGASGTYPYAIMRDTAYGQQTVANAQALANYLTRLDTATLSALNALGPSMLADKVPYATSNAAMAWATFTSYGRTLVAATTDATFASAAKVVRRSGGSNMGASNDVMLGWHSTEGQLIAQIDTVQLGKVWTDYYATTVGAADIRSKIGAFSTSGGSITGSVTVSGNITAGNSVSGSYLVSNTPVGSEGFLSFQSNGGHRILFSKTNEAESGGNVGSNGAIDRWSDAGGYLGTPLSINRRYGLVETRENPMCHGIFSGAGALTINAGQQLGILDDTGGFAFNRGGSGSAFTAGGNPGAGGKVVHISVSGLYKISATTVLFGAGKSVAIAANGNAWKYFQCGSADWTNVSHIWTGYILAGQYLSWLCTSGPVGMVMSRSEVIIEFIQQ